MQNDLLKPKILPVIILFILIFAVSIFIFRSPDGGTTGSAELDSFARCLAEKNITMYGADWCPHCQNEKKAFGDSFRLVPYVECPDSPQKCLAEGVKGYPTWIFPNGKKLEGEQGLKNLSRESGCELNKLGD